MREEEVGGSEQEKEDREVPEEGLGLFVQEEGL